jgi:hypothetical protein
MSIMKRTLCKTTSLRDRPVTLLRSDDGAVEFKLARIRSGVFVERVQVRTGIARVVQSVLFIDDSSFNRWCDADAVRFSHPVIYVNLKRKGDALFG